MSRFVVVGRFAETSGYGTAARRISDLLERYGIRVVRVDLAGLTHESSFDGDWRISLTGDRIEVAPDDPSTDIVCLAVCRPDQLNRIEVHGQCPLALWWFWEFNRVPSPWIDPILSTDATFVSSDFHAAACRSAAVPDFLVEKLFIPKPNVLPKPEADSGSSEGFKFLTVIGATDRKDLSAVLGGFALAFEERRSDVSLTIKLPNSSKAREFFDWSLERASTLYDLPLSRLRQNLSVNAVNFTDMDMQELIRDHDCYVSCEVASGWNIPAADALTYGKPVLGPVVGAMSEYSHVSEGSFFACGVTQCQISESFTDYIESVGSLPSVYVEDYAENMRKIKKTASELARSQARRRSDFEQFASDEVILQQLLSGLTSDPKRVALYNGSPSVSVSSGRPLW